MKTQMANKLNSLSRPLPRPTSPKGSGDRVVAIFRIAFGLTVLLAFSLPLCAAEKKLKANPSAKADPIPRPKPIKPPTEKEIQQSIRRGVDFLIGYQNKNGSWGSATRTKSLNIYAPVPGSHHAFRAATTSLCIKALIEIGDKRPEVLAALERGEAWLLDQLSRVRRANPTALYNVWAHSYSIQALLRMQERHGGDEKKLAAIRKLVELQIDLLNRYAVVAGGWGYYDFDIHTKQPGGQPTSFTTATAMIALKEAIDAGYEVPKPMLKKGLATIKRQQKPDFSYLYSENFLFYPMSGINRPGGSLGRSQACNLALRLWDDKRITDQVLINWLDRLATRNLWLDIGRKRPIPHESYFQVAGYFFYYGHYYAAGCIEQLPDEQQKKYRGYLANILLPLQEKDGSWWDYPLYDYHQSYGTAYSLMALGAHGYKSR
jgi:hypothetical protein